MTITFAKVPVKHVVSLHIGRTGGSVVADALQEHAADRDEPPLAGLTAGA